MSENDGHSHKNLWQPETNDLDAMIVQSRLATPVRALTPREREQLYDIYVNQSKIISAAQAADIRNWTELQIVKLYGKEHNK